MKGAPPSGAVNLTSRSRFGHRAMRDGADAISHQIRASQNRKNTGHGLCGLDLDLADHCVRVRRTNDRCVGLTGNGDIIAEISATGHKAKIFLADQRLANLLE